MVVLNKLRRAHPVVMAAGTVVHRRALRVDARERARHGDRHRTPDREQHGENHQQPDAKQLHESKVSRRTTAAVLERLLLKLATAASSTASGPPPDLLPERDSGKEAASLKPPLEGARRGLARTLQLKLDGWRPRLERCEDEDALAVMGAGAVASPGQRCVATPCRKAAWRSSFADP
jgi:hypothetical protein